MSDKAPLAGVGALAALLLVIIASVWLGARAQRAIKEGAFVKGFFLGNRALGSWAMALTATVQSGGTFMGFPSLVYTHGWVLALWVASYMVVPLASFGVLGKRLSQLSRRTGAITVPDLFRERFGSPAVGLTSSLLIMFFLAFMMVAQFKAGASIMKIAWPGTGVLSLSDEAPAYRLTAASWPLLAADGVADTTLARLKALEGRGFATRQEFDRELARVLGKDELKAARTALLRRAEQTDWLFYLGLAIFTLTVVGYSLVGGFLAAVWTDLFQSVLMFFGVILLFALAIPAVGGMEAASRRAAEVTGPGFMFGPGYAEPDPAHGDAARQFLPLGLAFSFFFTWVFSGVGSPAGMVRVMACKNTATLRRSIFLLGSYNAFIYLPLVMICIAARAMMPELKESDEVIPRMALLTTSDLPGGSFLAGLILAAPFGAVMATVSSYLIVIASGLVRDVYQRFVNHAASETEIRRLTYIVIITVGAIAVGANIRPIKFLQALVVFSGTGQAATFVTPIIMVAFWRRATVPGVMASMLTGAGTVVGLSAAGWLVSWFGGDPMIGQATSFRPYYLLGLDPVVWGLSLSCLAGISVSLLTEPPHHRLVSKLFDAQRPAAV